MRADFKLRSGKYEGKTYQWVMDNNPKYLAWLKENQPKMLVDREVPKKEVKVIDVKNESPKPSMTPNENFYDEAPDEQSIPYMLDHTEDYEVKLKQFEKQNKARFRLIKKEHAE